MPTSGTQTRGEGDMLSTARRRLDAAMDSPLRLEVLGTPAQKVHGTPRRHILTWSPDGGNVDVTRKFDYLRARHNLRPCHSPEQLIESSEEAARRLEEELHATRVALAESLRDNACMERQRDEEREKARMREIDIEKEREESKRREAEWTRDMHAKARDLERHRAREAASAYKHSVIVALLSERRIYRKRLDALWSTQTAASCVHNALASWQQHRHAQCEKRNERFWRSWSTRCRRVIHACVHELWVNAGLVKTQRQRAARRKTLEAILEQRSRALLQSCVAMWSVLAQRAIRGRLQLALTDSLDIAESLSAQKKHLSARASALQKMCAGGLTRKHALR